MGSGLRFWEKVQIHPSYICKGKVVYNIHLLSEGDTVNFILLLILAICIFFVRLAWSLSVVLMFQKFSSAHWFFILISLIPFFFFFCVVSEAWIKTDLRLFFLFYCMLLNAIMFLTVRLTTLTRPSKLIYFNFHCLFSLRLPIWHR